MGWGVLRVSGWPEFQDCDLEYLRRESFWSGYPMGRRRSVLTVGISLGAHFGLISDTFITFNIFF